MDNILIIDVDSRYTQHLARKVRELKVHSEILPNSAVAEVIRGRNPSGVIISGAAEPSFPFDGPLLTVAGEIEDEELARFLFKECGCTPQWDMKTWADSMTREIRKTVGQGRVVCGLSGGVDSTVAAVVTARAIGDRLDCIFVNNGLLRLGEAEQVLESYKKLNLKVHYADASDEFLGALAGVAEPEKKRKIIGETFIRVFEREASRLGDAQWLLQGTVYPDIIESGGKGGRLVKSHHNVGGLPEDMKLKVLEPLRDLFKDEVREAGRILGVPEAIVSRQPFPGPGLAVRCLGAVDKDRLDILRKADAIFRQELASWEGSGVVWQSFAVLLPIKTVGVSEGGRTYFSTVVLRAVESRDGMSADWVRIPYEIVARVSSRICEEVEGVNRVVLDVTGKPPATIEWE